MATSDDTPITPTYDSHTGMTDATSEFTDAHYIAALPQLCVHGTTVEFRNGGMVDPRFLRGTPRSGFWKRRQGEFPTGDGSTCRIIRFEFLAARQCTVFRCHNYVVGSDKERCSEHAKAETTRCVDAQWFDEVTAFLELHAEYAPGGSGFAEASQSFERKRRRTSAK